MPAHRTYSFGDYTLDLGRGALLRAGADVRLRPKSFEVLRLLVERHGQLVTREELLDSVWGDVVVSDGALGQCLIDVRRALDDVQQQIVRTVPRRGYIFDRPVVEAPGGVPEHLNGSSIFVAPPTEAAAPARASRLVPIVGALFLMAVAAAAAWWPLERRDVADAPLTALPAAAPRNSIAVLPFVDLSPEQDQEYFADGMSEEILNLLGNAPELEVIARTSSFSFKGRNADIAEIAAKLNVAHVLEGSVRKDGNRLRITAQLIDAGNSSHLWSETYDRQFEDAFSLQREIAARVSQALKVTLADHGDASPRLSTNAQALESYLRGRFFYNRRAPGDLKLAEENFRGALRLDPGYARAWEGLSGVYGAQMSESELPREQGLQLRWEALQKALQYDPNLAEAHIRLAWHYYSLEDEKRADEHAKRAYELDRDNPLVLNHFAGRLAWNDRMDEAMSMMERAVMLDPLSTVARGNFANYLATAGRYSEARTQLLKEIELNPTVQTKVAEDLTRLLILEGRHDEARASIAKLPPSDNRELYVAIVEHALGNLAAARNVVAAFESRSDPSAAVFLAEIYAERGDADRAFRWMGVARKRLGDNPWNSPNWHDGWKLRFSPFLRRFHDDPRWEAASRVNDRTIAG